MPSVRFEVATTCRDIAKPVLKVAHTPDEKPQIKPGKRGIVRRLCAVFAAGMNGRTAHISGDAAIAIAERNLGRVRTVDEETRTVRHMARMQNEVMRRRAR